MDVDSGIEAMENDEGDATVCVSVRIFFEILHFLIKNDSNFWFRPPETMKLPKLNEFSKEF